MNNENIVVVKKKSAFWTTVKIVLAVGAACLVAAKIYQKFFKNKKQVCELESDEETPALDCAEAEEEAEEADTSLEVPADAVIANAENMNEAAEN